MHEDEKYHNALVAWTAALDDVVNAQSQINIALRGLSEKRVTLEEKLIRAHLHQLSAQSARVTQEAHQLLTSHYDALSQNTLDELIALTAEVKNVVADLIKIIRYNLNFLEQYFEYDYYSRLQNEHKFVERMQKIVEQLQTIQTNASANADAKANAESNKS